MFPRRFILSPVDSGRRAFTLLEMLAVVSIVLIMMVAATPLMQFVTQGEPVTAAASTLSDMVNSGRTYATTHQSYVWLGLYQDATKGGLWIALASTGKTMNIGAEGVTLTQNGTFLRSIILKNRGDITTVFSGNPAPTVAGETVDDISSSETTAGAFTAMTLTISGQAIAFDRLIVFTPRGEAITKLNSTTQTPVYSRWIQAALVNQSGSAANAALIQIGGISPQCVTYRP